MISLLHEVIAGFGVRSYILDMSSRGPEDTGIMEDLPGLTIGLNENQYMEAELR